MCAGLSVVHLAANVKRELASPGLGIFPRNAFTKPPENATLKDNYRLLEKAVRKDGLHRMQGYNNKRRKLFVRIVAWVLVVLMVATVLSVLVFR